MMYGTVGRKSAVELLQESKAFYVKSETVLDRNQTLRHSKHLQVKTPIILHSSTLVLKKSPSSDLWLNNSTEYEARPQSVSLYPINYRSDASIQKEITSAQPKVKDELSPSEEERLLIEQLARAQESSNACKQCTCHVVFTKTQRKKSHSRRQTTQITYNAKSPKRELPVAFHQRSESVASRNQLQIKLRRLLWDDEFDDSSLQIQTSQQHKSMPDLRSSPTQGIVHDTLNNSPDHSIVTEGDNDRRHLSISPALTMPECTWTFFEGEPIMLSAPPEFMDKDVSATTPEISLTRSTTPEAPVQLARSITPELPTQLACSVTPELTVEPSTPPEVPVRKTRSKAPPAVPVRKTPPLAPEVPVRRTRSKAPPVPVRKTPMNEPDVQTQLSRSTTPELTVLMAPSVTPDVVPVALVRSCTPEIPVCIQDVPLDVPTSALLERFFMQMGLEDDALSISCGSSPVYFDSGGSAATPPHSSSGTDPQRINTETSVVERNARIIKWLCNCRKAGLRAPVTPS